MFATSWSEHDKAEAKERQKSKVGRTSKSSQDELRSGKLTSSAREPQSRDTTAARVGVGGKAIDKANKIKASSNKELARQVYSGELTLEKAYNEARRLEKQQTDATLSKQTGGVNRFTPTRLHNRTATPVARIDVALVVSTSQPQFGERGFDQSNEVARTKATHNIGFVMLPRSEMSKVRPTRLAMMALNRWSDFAAAKNNRRTNPAKNEFGIHARYSADRICPLASIENWCNRRNLPIHNGGGAEQ